jgi:peptidyl-prolyl cis-trans isomerase B (cyclophilin B)
LARSKARSSRRGSRSRTGYLVAGVLILVIVIAAAWYVYAQQNASTSNNSNCSPMTSTSTVIYGCISTSMGSMEIELFPTSAPQTVANFVSLANAGFYNNLVWHRIVINFVIQTGDPNTRNGGGNPATWGSGGSQQTVPLEIDPALHNNYSYIGMARAAAKNSGTSQFYINVANNNNLDGNYTVFGKVINGMSVAVAISRVSVNSADQPISLVLVTNVTIYSS